MQATLLRKAQRETPTTPASAAPRKAASDSYVRGRLVKGEGGKGRVVALIDLDLGIGSAACRKKEGCESRQELHPWRAEQEKVETADGLHQAAEGGRAQMKKSAISPCLERTTFEDLWIKFWVLFSPTNMALEPTELRDDAAFTCLL
jgi:hypothetical protein